MLGTKYVEYSNGVKVFVIDGKYTIKTTPIGLNYILEEEMGFVLLEECPTDILQGILALLPGFKYRDTSAIKKNINEILTTRKE